MTVALASPSSQAVDPHLPLVSDDDLFARVESLVPVAVRRQLWTLFLDADEVQLPMVVPLEGIPEHPDGQAVERWGDALDAVSAEFAVAAVVFVLERPGPQADTPSDVAWRRALRRLAEGRRYAVRAVFTCASDGVVAQGTCPEVPSREHPRPGAQSSPSLLRLSEVLAVC